MRHTQSIRNVVFMDAGVVTDSSSKSGWGQPTVGVGVGLVWKLKRFVRTDLRIELAQGFGPKGGKRVYAGTSMLF